MEECVIKHKGNFYLKTEFGYKKIILTTDQDLIKDGVQAIDDEFLEWFVANPSCKFVEVQNSATSNTCTFKIPVSNEWFPKRKFMEDISYTVGLDSPKDTNIGNLATNICLAGEVFSTGKGILEQQVKVGQITEKDAQEPIEKNSVWHHNNGNVYTVIEIANLDSKDLTKYPITVVYRGKNGKIWTRPLTDWHRSFTKVKSLKESLRNEIPDNVMSRAAVKYANDNNISSDDFCKETLIFAFYAGTECSQKQYDTSKVTRVEVIQHSPPHNGRAYVNYDAKDVGISLQDEGKTLKLFLK